VNEKKGPIKVSRASMLVVPMTHRDGRSAAIVVTSLIVLAMLAIFADTARSFVTIWLSSETFSHGFVVVPISVWLIWRGRAELAATPMQPCLPALSVVALSGLLWLVGHFAAANVVEQLALVLMIQSAILVLLGPAFVRAMAFPLLFLLFAVPFGEAFVPRMIDWTADFAVFALKLTAIPVFREGNNFALPSGHWSVVKACSGIRYLIASVMAGTLFAYLMYRELPRRLAFIAVSIAVPIVANWLRAYLIVLIGHLSGNELATGVDHVIYGWIFFGVVLLLMFAIGARFQSADNETTRAGMTAGGRAAGPAQPALIAAAAAILGLTIPWAAVGAGFLNESGNSLRLNESLIEMRGWRSVPTLPRAWQPGFAGERASRRQVFERDGQLVALDILYYSEQTRDRKLPSEANTVIAAADVARWHQTESGVAEINWFGSPLAANRSSIAGREGRFEVIWWYWIDGHVTSEDAIAKLRIALLRFRLKKDDAAVVFISTLPSDRSDGAAAAQFAADMGESINRVLTTARDDAAAVAGGPGR
jgi:exosortase A